MNCTFEIWMIPNGRMDDFRRGITGDTYPDGCRCWGVFSTLPEAVGRLRELAEEESLAEHRTDEFQDGIESPDFDDDASVREFDEKVEKRRLEFVEKCVDGLGFEWQQDLKWIRVVQHNEDGMSIL